MEIAQGDNRMYLSQRKYILDIIDYICLLGCHTASTPFPLEVKLMGDSLTPLQDAEKYRQVVEQLLYLNLTRPDILFATQQLG